MPEVDQTAQPASRRLLIIATDAVGDLMAGPGIRTWELARVLSSHLQVDLALPPFVETGAPARPDFPVRIHACGRMRELRDLVGRSDLLMTLGVVPLACPFVTRADKPLILDAYDPYLLAGLELHQGDPEKQLSTHEIYRRALLAGLGAADLILCASERQRDYWLGALSALGRVNPHNYRGDPTLSRLLRVVPFGLPREPPRQSRSVLKGVHPEIRSSDRVVLWGGGLWDWLDAKTAIRAMAHVTAARADVKLFFMGTQRPGRVTRMAAVEEVEALSRDLGLYGRSVLFNTEWVPYSDRQNYLLEADLGICLHHDTLETRLAFRTRLLDYVWTGLPVVATSGDTLSEEMHSEGLARTVAPGAERAVADAILELLGTADSRARMRPRFEAMAARYTWDVVASPLVEFCRDPHVSPDRAHRSRALPFSWQKLAAKARRVLARRRLAGS
jgi:glycosyltransferase involved in cell wall biosynthesis